MLLRSDSGTVYEFAKTPDLKTPARLDACRGEASGVNLLGTFESTDMNLSDETPPKSAAEPAATAVQASKQSTLGLAKGAVCS